MFFFLHITTKDFRQVASASRPTHAPTATKGSRAPPFPTPTGRASLCADWLARLLTTTRWGAPTASTSEQTRQKVFNRAIYTQGVFNDYEHTVWANNTLFAKDQLRQCMTWALYQIVPINLPSSYVWNTETWLLYYDIFVCNALGSYGDILKQISFTDLMTEWLSFFRIN